jgi:hypothetical protein
MNYEGAFLHKKADFGKHPHESALLGTWSNLQ